MKKTLVILPTYNEIETVVPIIDSIIRNVGVDVLVVDDASPDRTASAVKELMAGNRTLFILERTVKLGLGSAYIAGFKWGIDRNYDYFIEMDADGSHDPLALQQFLVEMEKGYDLIIGSRYMDNKLNVVGWDLHRLLLSKFGIFYASKLMGLGFSDLTSGYRCFSRKALASIDIDCVGSNGYAFQIEMTYLAVTAGLKVGEIPIVFYERGHGSSKMSFAIIMEAASLPWRIKAKKLKEFFFRNK